MGRVGKVMRKVLTLKKKDKAARPTVGTDENSSIFANSDIGEVDLDKTGDGAELAGYDALSSKVRHRTNSGVFAMKANGPGSGFKNLRGARPGAKPTKKSKKNRSRKKSVGGVATEVSTDDRPTEYLSVASEGTLARRRGRTKQNPLFQASVRRSTPDVTSDEGADTKAVEAPSPAPDARPRLVTIGTQTSRFELDCGCAQHVEGSATATGAEEAQPCPQEGDESAQPPQGSSAPPTPTTTKRMSMQVHETDLDGESNTDEHARKIASEPLVEEEPAPMEEEEQTPAPHAEAPAVEAPETQPAKPPPPATKPKPKPPQTRPKPNKPAELTGSKKRKANEEVTTPRPEKRRSTSADDGPDLAAATAATAAPVAAMEVAEPAAPSTPAPTTTQVAATPAEMQGLPVVDAEREARRQALAEKRRKRKEERLQQEQTKLDAALSIIDSFDIFLESMDGTSDTDPVPS